MNYNPFFNPYYTKYNNSYYNYCPPITYTMIPDSYNYNNFVQSSRTAEGQFDEGNISDIKTFNENNAQITNISDVISITENRISILGLGINIDDLIILVLLFSILKNGESVDYALVVVLGILLFSQE